MSNISHKNRYKNQPIDSQELRRRREEEGVQIRKSKRDEQLSKRRNVTESHNVPDLEEIDDAFLMDKTIERDVSGEVIISTKMIELLYSDNEDDQLIAIRKFRKLLSREPSPPIDQVINTGIMPRFVQLLRNDKNSLLQVSF